MRKQLSLNGKPRSTNKAKGQRFFAPGYVPSFSNVIASVEKLAPKAKSIDEQREALLRKIRKLTRRIDKHKVFLGGRGNALDVPLPRETPAQTETRLKLMRWDSLRNRCIFLLEHLQSEHNRISDRETKKFLGSTRDINFLTEEQKKPGMEPQVGHNKVVQDAISGENSKPYQPMVVDYKKSTPKKKRFKLYDPSEPTDEKASDEFRRVLVERKNLVKTYQG